MKVTNLRSNKVYDLPSEWLPTNVGMLEEYNQIKREVYEESQAGDVFEVVEDNGDIHHWEKSCRCKLNGLDKGWILLENNIKLCSSIVKMNKKKKKK